MYNKNVNNNSWGELTVTKNFALWVFSHQTMDLDDWIEKDESGQTRKQWLVFGDSSDARFTFNGCVAFCCLIAQPVG
jgi:hypothetical protein